MALSINGRITTKGTRFGKTAAGFDPVTFWSGQTGGFWNFADGANLWANTARTTPASVDGSVNGVTDLSGLGNHLTSASAYPFTMKSGYCLSDQGGAMITINTISMGFYTAFALVRPITMNTAQNIVDTDYGTGNRVSQNLIIWSDNLQLSYIFGFSSPAVFKPTPTLVTNTDYYLATAVDNTNALLRGAGTSYTSGSGGSLAGGVAPIAIGASFGATLTPQYQDFLGRIYCAAWIGKKCTEAEIIDVGNYMNTLAGISASI